MAPLQIAGLRPDGPAGEAEILRVEEPAQHDCPQRPGQADRVGEIPKHHIPFWKAVFDSFGNLRAIGRVARGDARELVPRVAATHRRRADRDGKTGPHQRATEERCIERIAAAVHVPWCR